MIQNVISRLLKLFTNPHKIAVCDLKTEFNVSDVLTRSEDTNSEDYPTYIRPC